MPRKNKKNKKKEKNKLRNKYKFDKKEVQNENLNKSFIKKESNLYSTEDNKINLNISYDLEILEQSKIKKEKEQKYQFTELKEFISINNNLKIFSYSITPKQIYNDLIFQYFFDKFEQYDYDKAYIIIFIGKKGDGKRSTINSLFNVIKGVNPDSNSRYFLIKKGKEDLENGLHLYYLKDINNNPIIIINCQGYGDIRGKEYDEEINKAFAYLFNNLIHHINLVCFIGKERYEKLNIFDRYIFNCATSLFTEDVIENFIILVTHANENMINNEWSSFISSLSDDINFDDIKIKAVNKWKYYIDNESIFLDKVNDLTKYSFQQLNEIYKDKILNSKPKITKHFPKFINYKIEIIPIVKNIISNFNNLKIGNNKIPNIENNIKEYENQIQNKKNLIYSKENQINSYNYYLDYYRKELNSLESEHHSKMWDLDNQYETITNRVLDSSSCEHTYCNNCKKNCHEYCDCIGYYVNRCTVFPIFGDSCEKCGHSKSSHSLHSKYRYIDKYERRKIDNYNKKNDENNRYNRRKNEINNSISFYRNYLDKYYSEKSMLTNEKNSLENSKNYYVSKKQRINYDIKKLSEEISSLINKLIEIESNIKKEAMNKFHVEIERDYINALIEEFKKNSNYNSENKIKKLEELKEYIQIYDELTSNYIYLLGFKMCSNKN